MYFQHLMLLAPCVMCIYERIAMLRIGVAALIGAIAPQNPVVRWLGFAFCGASSYKGLMLAIEHVNYQFNPSPLLLAICLPPSVLGSAKTMGSQSV